MSDITVWDAVGLTLSDPKVPQRIKGLLNDKLVQALEQLPQEAKAPEDKT